MSPLVPLISDHMIGYGVRDFLCCAILSEIFPKVSLGVHEIHDDGVVHLYTGGENGV